MSQLLAPQELGRKERCRLHAKKPFGSCQKEAFFTTSAQNLPPGTRTGCRNQTHKSSVAPNAQHMVKNLRCCGAASHIKAMPVLFTFTALWNPESTFSDQNLPASAEKLKRGHGGVFLRHWPKAHIKIPFKIEENQAFALTLPVSWPQPGANLWAELMKKVHKRRPSVWRDSAGILLLHYRTLQEKIQCYVGCTKY